MVLTSLFINVCVLILIIFINCTGGNLIDVGDQTDRLRFHKHKHLGFSSSNHVINTLSWVVKLTTQRYTTIDYSSVANRLSHDIGLINKGQIGHLVGHYEFEHHLWDSHKRQCDDANLQCNNLNNEDYSSLQDEISNALNEHPSVKWFSHLQARRRVKRNLVFNDPYYAQQWHLVGNTLFNKNCINKKKHHKIIIQFMYGQIPKNVKLGLA